LRDERSDRIAEDRGVAWLPAEMDGVDEAGRKRVAAAGAAHHVDGERRNLLIPFAADDPLSMSSAPVKPRTCSSLGSR